ncbi:MAG: U32 family peptidase [Candidatus Margulisiibacteriota bacterium]
MDANKPELLIPAGDTEKLRNAVLFGADAVYLGAGPYSLRAQATSFNLDELQQAIKFCHEHQVKVYLAMNIFAFDEDLSKMIEYLKSAIEIGIDGVIISDPGVLSLIRKLNTKVKIHLSTQTNTINSEAVKFWREQGIKRVVLGREVSLAQAKEIKSNVPDIELELFVHGAMCISYSGRCLLSKHMTGRSANRGECTQPCRWKYRLKEVSRPDEEFSIEEDGRGTYIMNSKDLCMVEYLPELVNAGIDSFKVEGRMKSPYYVALVTKIYRQAINAKGFDPRWKEELLKISHRQYTTGFYFGDADRENIAGGACIRDYNFVGVVESWDPKTRQLEIKARNYFGQGDTLEIIDPQAQDIKKIRINKIRTDQNEEITEAHNDYHVFASLDTTDMISKYSLLRRKRQ